MPTAPSLNGLNAAIDVVEGGDPVLLDASVAFAAPDGVANATLTVSGLATGDRIGLADGGGFTLSGGVLTMSGRTVGSVRGGIDSSSFAVTLSPDATAGDVQAVLQHLTYASVADAPLSHHTLTIDLVDASGQRLNGQSAAMPMFQQAAAGADPFAALGAPGAAVAFMDFDGDGDLDLFAAPSASLIINTFVNSNGGYALAPRSADAFGSFTRPMTDLAFFDYDGDGDLDLLGTGRAILIYSQDGGFAPNFTLPSITGGLATNHLLVSSTPFDVDGDGDLDLLLSFAPFFASGSLLLWYRNDGGGAWAKQFTAPFSDLRISGLLAMADVDGDGDQDMVLGQSDGTIVLARNDGGTFVQLLGTDNPFSGIDVGFNANPEFLDLDADGDLDMVVANSAGVLTTYYNQSSLRSAVTVNIAPISDRAVLSGLSPLVTFGENLVNSAPQIIDGAVAFTHPDRNLHGGAILTVSGILPEDRVSILSTGPGTGPLDLLAAGGNLTYQGVTVGSYLGGQGGTLTVLLNASATPAVIDLIIERLTYANDSDHPTLSRTLTIDLTDGASNHLAAPGSVTIAIAPDNEGHLRGLNGAATFLESDVNAGPKPLDALVTFEDPSFAGGKLTITGLLAEDRLSVLDHGMAPGWIGVSGATVSFGGTAIGSVSGGDGTPLVVTLNGAATPEAVSILVSSLGFADASDAPTAERTLQLILTDPEGAAVRAQSAAFQEVTGAANPFAALAHPAGQTSFYDLDGDGDLDLVTVGLGEVPHFYRNDGGVYTELTGSDAPVFAGLTSFDQSFLYSVGYADYDGDGVREWFFGGYQNIEAFRFDGHTLSSVRTWPTFDSQIHYVTGGDIDGDGDDDILFGNGSGTLRYISNDVGANWPIRGAGDPIVDGLPTGPKPRPALGDLDGDGDMDLVIGREDGTIVYLENKDGTFVMPFGANNPFNALANRDFGSNVSPALVDFNGDGTLDLLVSDNVGQVFAFANLAENISIKVRVTAQDDAPIARPDAAATNEATALAIAPLANDDADGGPIRLASIAGVAVTAGQALALPSGALATLRADGTILYDPNHAFDWLVSDATGSATGARNVRATDSISYALDNGGSATIEVTVTGLDSAQNRLYGDAGANLLVGTSLDDVFNVSQGGDDRVDGGAGNDDFDFGAAFSDADRVDGGGGTSDRIDLRGDYTGAHALTLGANSMTGIEQIVLLPGFSYSIETADANVDANAVLAIQAGSLQPGQSLNFDGSAEIDGRFLIYGGQGNDTLIGGHGADSIFGGAGRDVLVGRDGDDALHGGIGAANEVIGGTGNDQYFVETAGDTLVELPNEGTDTVLTALASYSIANRPDIENLTGLSTAGQTLTGNGGDNAIAGGSGNDRLFGGLGRDVLAGGAGKDLLSGGDGVANEMIGGLGDDTYVVTALGDTLVELADEGTDSVLTTLHSYTLRDNFETLIFTGTGNFNGTGNLAANTIVGGAGDDRLAGGGGAANLLIGGGGNDIYVVSVVGDTIFEQAGGGIDTVETGLTAYRLSAAEVENLTGTSDSGQTLIGNNSANVMTGGAGNDLIDGGLGADTLIGNAGADHFLFDTALGGGNIDAIVGFTTSSDRILLDNTIFTQLNEGGLAPGAFVIGTRAGDSDDRIIYDATTGNLYYDADGSGADAAVQFATLSGHPILTANDFGVI